MGGDRNSAAYRAAAELRARQLTLALCCGMPEPVIASALGLQQRAVHSAIWRLVEDRGMTNRIEFAIQQNAAVREKFWISLP